MNVALVIPTSNRPDFLPRAVHSAINQETPFSRIIIVNDHPQPLPSLPSDPRLVILHTSLFEGPAAARQLAINTLADDLDAICYLDDDDELLPNHNATLLDAIKDGTQFAFSKARFITPDFHETSDPEPNNNTQKRYYDPQALFGQNIAPISSFIHTLDAARQIGGWDPQLLRLEDWDFWARMSIRFGPPKFIDKVTNIIHKGHSSLTNGELNYSLACSWRDIVSDRLKILFSENRAIISESDKVRFHIPKVGIVMPFYNAQRFLPQAIESIRNQTFTDFELIGINDCSSDNSRSIFIDYAQRDPRLRLFEMPKRSGVAATLNFGLLVSRSEYVARMDADDVSEPRRLEAQVEFLNRNRDILVVGTNFWSMREDLSAVTWENWLPSSPEEVKKQLLDYCCIGHPTVMMRRRAVEIIGGYGTAAEVETVEDYDLWMRIVQNHKIANIPEFLLKYRHHPEQVSSAKREMQDANFLRIRSKYRKMAGLPEAVS